MAKQRTWEAELELQLDLTRADWEAWGGTDGHKYRPRNPWDISSYPAEGGLAAAAVWSGAVGAVGLWDVGKELFVELK